MTDTKEPSTNMLYVSNLPFTFEDADLKAVFNGYEVTQAYVATRRNGRSKGFGFVTFGSQDQQKKALSALDSKELDGRKLTVKVAHKDDRRDAKGGLLDAYKTDPPRKPRNKDNKQNNAGENNNNAKAEKKAPAERKAPAEKKPSETVVYVSNLPFEFTDADLNKVFEKYKPTSARIARRRNERSKGFGFVEFGNSADQKAALALDGHNIDNRPIQVKISVAADRAAAAPAADGAKAQGEKKSQNKPKEEKKKGGDKASAPAKPAKESAPAELSETTVYVSNLPFDLTDAALAEIFSAKGPKPVSAHIARKQDDRSKGFGFVQFASNADQKAALSLDGANLQDRQLSVKVAKKGSETRASEAGDKEAKKADNKKGDVSNDNNKDGEGKRKRRGKKADAAGGEEKKKEAAPAKEKKPSDTLVYVSNLAFQVDDNALAKLFDGLTIKSAHVAVRRNGRSKGFGFVEFSSHADQVKALAKSGSNLEGRVLTVEVAHEKLGDDK